MGKVSSSIIRNRINNDYNSEKPNKIDVLSLLKASDVKEVCKLRRHDGRHIFIIQFSKEANIVKRIMKAELDEEKRISNKEEKANKAYKDKQESLVVLVEQANTW